MIENLIKELEGNKKVNKRKGLQNIVDIDYILERLRDIQLDVELLEQYAELYKDLCSKQAEKINELRGSDNNG